MRSYEINIYGRVQGIGFRKKIKDFFKSRNLVGSVENLDNGSVRVLVKCEKKDLSDFEDFLDKMNLVCVRNFEIKEIKNFKELKNFKIKKEDNFFVDKLKSFFNLKKYIFGFSFTRNYLDKIPLHVAIIPDGNRRWAKKRGMIGFKGHEKAGETKSLISLFNEARKLGVKYVSFWGFSTDNWKRDKEENDKLFNVFLKGIEEFKKYAHENKIRFRHIGRKDRFSKEIVDALIKLESETEEYNDYNIQLCLDYGGRDEILRAVNRLLQARAKKVNEKQFSMILDTKEIPEYDLIIRTSGEKRLSGFMPYQGVYAELIFVKKHFPSFSKKDIRKALREFSKRKRRFGGE